MIPMGCDATYTMDIPADHRHLSDGRIESMSWLESNLGSRARCDEIVADASVVLTELASNVIDHTDSESIALRIEVHQTVVVVEVGNQGDTGVIPDVSQWGVLEEGDRGRGLRIVRAICRDIDISQSGPTAWIRASIALS